MNIQKAKPQQVFALMFFIIMGINLFDALKSGYAPWPPAILYSAIGLGMLLALASLIDPTLAIVIGAGFILVRLMGTVTDNKVLAAIPPADMPYDLLKFRGI